MRVVVQRVKNALVSVDNQIINQIDHGFLIYIGIHQDDTEEMILKMADKVGKLRVFEDNEGKMNLSLKDVKGSCLVISQFTLYGDTKKNNRPSFITAAKPKIAMPLYELFIETLKKEFEVKTGVFGAHMEVMSNNDGPVTILMEM
ncbi:MAG: D-tyrosyl-tRNA(Tyr) deacylase [Candidatus Phytoplasma sp.]|nr:D-tyrosyl-tRNA(Tyr) deacylase [Phytoplasma sp.]